MARDQSLSGPSCRGQVQREQGRRKGHEGDVSIEHPSDLAKGAASICVIPRSFVSPLKMMPDGVHSEFASGNHNTRYALDVFCFTDGQEDKGNNPWLHQVLIFWGSC